jgi:hypothetical protein
MQKGTRMKTIKLTKRLLRMHPLDLLVKLGAVDTEKKCSYPQHVYFSREDHRELKKNLKQYAKKKMPNGNERLISYAVDTDLLCYGPSELLSDAIRPGFALVNEDAIKLEIVTRN